MVLFNEGPRAILLNDAFWNVRQILLARVISFLFLDGIKFAAGVHLYDDDGGYLFVLRILAYMGYSYHSYLVPHKNIHNGLYTLILNHVTSMQKLEIEWILLSNTS